MSQPLGITKEQERLYLEFLQSPHDFTVDVDVLTMEERVVTSLSPQFKDGQVNIQRDGEIKRTASLTLLDPDHSLRFDSDSPFLGGIFANRMIRYSHIVDVPGVGVVSATAIVGPIVRAQREGDDLILEVDDKTRLAVEGCPPKTVKEGMNAVAAIKEIMRDRTGERRFRFPKSNRKRLKKNYSVGWKAEASPWAVCQKIARNELDMQLIYSCDGALLLRRRPTAKAMDLTALTGPIRSEYDTTAVRNYVRVTGEKKKATEAPKKTKHTEFTVDASAPRLHPMSPQKLGRHGVNRYLPLLIDDSSLNKESEAQQKANRELKDALPQSVRASFSGAPVFHLDYGDIVRAHTEDGEMSLPLWEASIPLGLSGDMEYGAQKDVGKPRRAE